MLPQRCDIEVVSKQAGMHLHQRLIMAVASFDTPHMDNIIMLTFMTHVIIAM